MTQAIDETDQLIGAVAHDIAGDPFPVKGIDHLRFLRGQRQAGRALLLHRVRHDLRRLPRARSRATATTPSTC